MSRKIFPLALALVLCLWFVPQAAFAAAGLRLGKAAYKAGETITVTVTGVTRKMETDGAWVGIYKKGAPHDEYGVYGYVKAGTNKVTLPAPEQGVYEVRLYSKTTPYDATTFVAKAPFKVARQSMGAAAVSLGKVYAPGEAIVIATTGITQQMVGEGAFVAIYKAGAPHDQWGAYAYPKEGDGQVELAAPQEAGAYEIRLYRKDGDYTNASFVTKVPFSVSQAPLNKTSNPDALKRAG